MSCLSGLLYESRMNQRTGTEESLAILTAFLGRMVPYVLKPCSNYCQTAQSRIGILCILRVIVKRRMLLFPWCRYVGPGVWFDLLPGQYEVLGVATLN